LFREVSLVVESQPNDSRFAALIKSLANGWNGTDDLTTLVREQTFDEAPWMSAIRKGLRFLVEAEFPQASDALRPLARRSANAHIRALSGFLMAQAFHLQGAIPEAESALSEAETVLQSMLRAGDLGPAWRDIVLCLVVREHTIRVVSNVSPTPPIDSAFLALKRVDWQPVKTAIDGAFELARARRWGDAALNLKAAMSLDGFSWEAAECTIPRWALKLGVIFALADDAAGYDEVCAHYDTDRTLRSADMHAIVLFPLRTRNNSSGRFLLNPRHAAFVADTEGVRHVPEWMNLLIGMELMADGDLESAAMEFEQAHGAYDLHCSCAALAFAAQASAAFRRHRHRKQSPATS